MKTPLLEITSLNASVEGKPIIKELNLVINEGEVHVLFGPNGSGKSTLLATVMGLPGYRIDSGEIRFRGKPLQGLTTDLIAKEGIGLSFQHPPTIHGVTLERFLKSINRSEALDAMISTLAMKEFLSRDLNTGFSGGELKRAEILKLYAQNPDLLLIDEPESGVDLENIAIIAGAINTILQQEIPFKLRKKSGLLITHTGHILEYVDADIGHIFMDGAIVCSGTPQALMKDIRERGFNGCIDCISEQRSLSCPVKH